MHSAYAGVVKISSERHLRRQQALRELVAECGGVTALAALSGTPKSHVSAMLSGARGVGDTLAARLERVAKKPAGWMDASNSAAQANGDAVQATVHRSPSFQPQPSVPDDTQEPPDDWDERTSPSPALWRQVADELALAAAQRKLKVHPVKFLAVVDMLADELMGAAPETVATTVATRLRLVA